MASAAVIAAVSRMCTTLKIMALHALLKIVHQMAQGCRGGIRVNR
jgi:hypothetical protein